MRVRNKIGDDSLDALIKEMIAEKVHHIGLMVDRHEQDKLSRICEAIFLELLTAFFGMTLQNARDLDNNIKTFRFSKEYIDNMTDRQKRLLSPALKMIGFENQLKLCNFELTGDWTVRYIPERIPNPFTRQEETIKDQIKTFVQKTQ